MVFFTCNHCGESVKKNKVETHAVRCSRQISVSCMDCNKDFDKQTYSGHVKCVTEQEKYSAKGFVAKPTSTKGLTKQQEWLSLVNSVIASAKNLPAEDRKLLTVISKYQNVPRKKNKFENFLKNGVFMGSQECVDRVWTMLQQKWSEVKSSGKEDPSVFGTASENQADSEEAENTPPKRGKESKKLSKLQKKAAKTNGEESLSEVGNQQAEGVNLEEPSPRGKKPKKGKKRRAGAADESGDSNKLEAEPETVNGDASPSPNKKAKKELFGFIVDTIGNSPLSQELKKKQKQVNVSLNNSLSPNKESPKKFNWQDAIVKVLSSSEKKEFPVKVLRKKVLAQYASDTHQPITGSIKIKFAKRLQSVPGVKTSKGKAVLSSTA